MLCLCCEVLVFFELHVCAQTPLVSLGIRGIPRLERESAFSTQVEADRQPNIGRRMLVGGLLPRMQHTKVVNELMTRNLCNQLGQEHRRGRMMTGGVQSTKNLECVGSERIKRGDDTLKRVVQSTVILCGQLGLCVAGEVRATTCF